MFEDAERMASIYTLEGINDLIEDARESMHLLIVAKNSPGKTWTESKIESWISYHEKEIQEKQELIQQLEKCYAYKLLQENK